MSLSTLRRALRRLLDGREPDGVPELLRRSGAHIAPPYYVTGHRNIELGANVHIGPYSRIEAIESLRGQQFSPSIRIGEGTSIEWHLTLIAVNRCEIGRHVMISSNVFITDTTHGHADGSAPYLHQPLHTGGHVVIGDGCWIGINAVIMANVTIGAQSIVGSNSVVKSDVPPFTMVAGAPAKVVRVFDHATAEWRKP